MWKKRPLNSGARDKKGLKKNPKNKTSKRTKGNL